MTTASAAMNAKKSGASMILLPSDRNDPCRGGTNRRRNQSRGCAIDTGPHNFRSSPRSPQHKPSAEPQEAKEQHRVDDEEKSKGRGHCTRGHRRCCCCRSQLAVDHEWLPTC